MPLLQCRMAMADDVADNSPPPVGVMDEEDGGGAVPADEAAATPGVVDPSSCRPWPRRRRSVRIRIGRRRAALGPRSAGPGLPGDGGVGKAAAEAGKNARADVVRGQMSDAAFRAAGKNAYNAAAKRVNRARDASYGQQKGGENVIGDGEGGPVISSLFPFFSPP